MKYFIDTNIIIDLLHNNGEGKETLKAIIEEENSELFINRLVLTECLRTIPSVSTNIFDKAKIVLERFQKLDITPDIYNKTIEFSRFFKTVKHQSLKGKCEAIDLLHFITAKHYGLEIISNDKDFDKLEKAYIEFASD